MVCSTSAAVISRGVCGLIGDLTADGATMPSELRDAAGLPRLMAALRARGYTDGDLVKLAHGNWVRVLRETWGA